MILKEICDKKANTVFVSAWKGSQPFIQFNIRTDEIVFGCICNHGHKSWDKVVFAALFHTRQTHLFSPSPKPPTMLDTCTHYLSRVSTLYWVVVGGGGGEQRILKRITVLYYNSVNKTKQNKTKQNKTKQNKTKQNKTKQNKTKQNKTKKKQIINAITQVSQGFLSTIVVEVKRTW